MDDIKIERLTVEETSKVNGGRPYDGKPGGTTGNTEDWNCICCCG